MPEIGIDEDVDLLGDPESEDTPDLKEDEEEEKKEEPDDEPKEDPGPAADRAAYKDIKAKYPTIFKEFPSLRTSFFRDKEFSNIFPTIEDAKNAEENSQFYTNFSSDILEGNGDKFVSALEDVGDLGTFGQKFFDNLEKKDPALHFQIVSPYLDQVVKSFYNYGSKHGSEDIKNAAEFLADYLFGDNNYAKSESKVSGIRLEPKNPELERERQSYRDRQSSDFQTRSLSDLGNKLTLEINKGFPEGISEKTKKMIADEVFRTMDMTLGQDKAHMSFMNSLWKKAADEGYTQEASSRIHNAYLERAKKVISSERRKLIAEVTGVSPAESERLRGISTSNEKRVVGGGGKPGGGPSKVAARNVDWKRTSDLDFLNDKVSMKKGR